jgi:predicted permease
MAHPLPRLFDGLAKDLRFALRGLLRTPVFVLSAVVILGVGIGANTTMFSAVNSILLRPLAYHEPERLVVVLHDGRAPVSPANLFDWRESSRSFERMGAAEYWRTNLDAGDHAEQVLGLRLTADILPLLGVPPMLGRVFTADDEKPGNELKAVIGYALWQRRFGGDPAIVGRTVRLDGERYDIVGVMPREFAFAPFWATGAQIWAPLPLADRRTSRSGNSLRVFARLAPGVTIEQARAEMAGITARLEQEYPGTNRRVTVTSLTERVVGNARLALLVLLAAVGFVLLIACANVAHMLLARAAARQRELAVRLALGATRWQIVRPWLVECLLLAALSGAAGLVLAMWGVKGVVALTAGDLPRIDELGIDGRVLGFTLAISTLTGLVFGVMPAFQGRSAPVADALRDSGRGAGGTKQASRLRDLLVVSEFALAITLLVGAGLMVRSFAALQAIDPGFDPRQVLSMIVSVNGSPEEAPARRADFYRRAIEAVRALPGVESASAINHLPIDGDLWGRSFLVDGRPQPKPGDEASAVYRVVLPGYFETMRLPILRGRDVSERDVIGAPGVVVINDYMARTYWPGQDAVGQRISLGGVSSTEPREWLTVVGVVRDAALHDWEGKKHEEIYLPYLQTPSYLQQTTGAFTYLTFVVRTTGDPASFAPSARQAIWSIEKTVALADVQTLEAAIGEAMARPRFQLTLLASFAGVALLLAAAGIYSVMSYAIARRTREIGLRMTLGAQRRDVLTMVLGQAMVRVAVGAVAGLLGALALTRLMATLLYGVAPTDPLTFAAVSVVLVSVALVASYLPARRATQIDPMAAIREP